MSETMTPAEVLEQMQAWVDALKLLTFDADTLEQWIAAVAALVAERDALRSALETLCNVIEGANGDGSLPVAVEAQAAHARAALSGAGHE
jgi:hypothetical protein